MNKYVRYEVENLYGQSAGILISHSEFYALVCAFTAFREAPSEMDGLLPPRADENYGETVFTHQLEVSINEQTNTY